MDTGRKLNVQDIRGCLRLGPIYVLRPGGLLVTKEESTATLIQNLLV